MKLPPIALAALLLVPGSHAIAQTTATAPQVIQPWKLDVGLNYVTGKYGLSQDTTVWVQTTSVSYEANPWKFEATLPLVSLHGPATIIGNVGRASSTTERGLGDVTMAATYKILQPGAKVSDFDVTGRVKLPTADQAKGLGTGQTDFDLEANYHHSFGTLTPFATLGYRFLGRSTAYPLKDGLYSTVGVAAPLEGSDNTVGAALTWRQPIVAGADHATELMAFLNHRMDAGWHATTYVLTGFTNASPDLGVGASVGFKF